LSYNSVVRTHEFWDALVARLRANATLTTLLGGANRVYKVTDDFSEPEDSTDTRPWGRVVVVPSNTLWPSPDVAGQTKTVSWLMRVEFNDFAASGYSVDVSMDAALAAVDSLLVGWLPTGFSHVLVALPVFRFTSPRALAEWDETRGVWWKSIEYRTEVSPL
jgi:hypothetical protein